MTFKKNSPKGTQKSLKSAVDKGLITVKYHNLLSSFFGKIKHVKHNLF